MFSITIESYLKNMRYTYLAQETRRKLALEINNRINREESKGLLILLTE